MKLHEPCEKLTRYQVKRARQHAKLHGPGTIPEKEQKYRVRFDMGKVEFANRPYFHQDVAYGSRILKLDSAWGENQHAKRSPDSHEIYHGQVIPEFLRGRRLKPFESLNFV